jgi:O-antigen ligase
VPLGTGLYISFSRGALFACAAGLVTLIALVPRREQLESIGIVLVAAVIGCLVAAPQHGFTSLSGSLSHREQQGAIVFVVLVALAAAAAGLQLWRIARASTGALNLPRRSPLIAVTVIAAGLGLAIVLGAKEKSAAPLSGGAARLGTLQSNRYAYWGVALKAFADEPVRGVGAGGWAVDWLRDRHINSFAQDAHSLPLQTLAELGLVGLALLAAFLAGIAGAGARAHGLLPALAGGPAAGLAAYIAHAPLDWDWEMPALTMVAMILGGALIALAQAESGVQSSSAMRGASRRNIQTANTQTVA